MNITARILISSFPHFAVPGGISGGHAQDIRSWHLKRESGLNSLESISIKKNVTKLYSAGRVIAGVKFGVQLSECASLVHVKRVVCTSAYSYAAMIKGLQTAAAINVERSNQVLIFNFRIHE